MKGMFKRGICLSLTLVTAFCFTGCGKKSTGESLVDSVAKASKDYVFAQEVLDVAKDGQEVNRLAMVGDRVYASTAGIGGDVYIYSFNSDGSDLKTITLPTTDNDSFSYISYDAEGNIYAIDAYSEYVYGDEDGPVTTYEATEITETEAEAESQENDAVSEPKEEGVEETSEETSDETSQENVSEEQDIDDITIDGGMGSDATYLMIYDKDGNLKEQLSLNEDYEKDGYVGTNSLTVTDDGIVLISLDQGIVRYRQDMGFKYLVDNSKEEDYNYYHFIKGSDGRIYVSFYGDDGRVVCPFDAQTGEIGDPYKALSGGYDNSFFEGVGYDLYLSNRDGIFGYDIASDSLNKILDFVDSDIDATDSLISAVGISKTEFVTILPDIDYNYYVSRFTKIPPEQVKDRTIITLGGYYIDYDVRKKALQFNKTNSEYKIKFVDYSSYDTEDNYGVGAEKLNMDIVSGNTPDILMLEDDMPIDSYINKGLFTDLTGYLANDPDVSEADLLTNVVDAFKTGDKLYQIAPNFYISTMVVKSKFADGKDVLSLKDCQDLMSKVGASQLTAFGFMSRNEFLEQGIRFSGNSYIDWENKACHFDSEAFVNFLEFSKGFYEEIPESLWDDYKETAYRTDDALFAIRGYSAFEDFQYVKQVTFGTDISYVGYPNDLGINNSIIYPNMRMAICAQSKSKDACWSFIKNFFTEEYQDEGYYFPILRTSFDKRAQKITRKTFFVNDGKEEEYDDTYYVGGEEIIIQPFTQEEMQEVKNFIESLTLVCNYNENVNNIIFEEASAFYSGQKSAKEVADIIQSRLSIYVNENS